jgi:hypothetical protein
MGRLEFSIVGVMVVVLVQVGCKDSSPTQPPGDKSFVMVVDKGAVVPDPVETLVVVEPEKISGASMQNGVASSTWSSKIDSQDYIRLVRFAIDSLLFRGPEPQFGPGSCEGARELVVYITIDGLADTITVPGFKRCNSITWPAGLRSLVSFKDALVTKYHR